MFNNRQHVVMVRASFNSFPVLFFLSKNIIWEDHFIKNPLHQKASRFCDWKLSCVTVDINPSIKKCSEWPEHNHRQRESSCTPQKDIRAYRQPFSLPSTQLQLRHNYTQTPPRKHQPLGSFEPETFLL